MPGIVEINAVLRFVILAANGPEADNFFHVGEIGADIFEILYQKNTARLT